MPAAEIYPIAAFSDNYIWALVDHARGTAAVVDPGQAQPVLDFLHKRQLRLTCILITHHHADHVGGLHRLLDVYEDTRVYGPAREDIAGVEYRLHGGDRIALPLAGLTMDVVDVPGHTAGHIAYVCRTEITPLLFCGDTLFAAGCGRLFEGTAAQMHASLTRLAQLSMDTRIYCAHEYTESNLRFAAAVEPENPAIAARRREAAALRKKMQPTLPSTLALELQTNPFLRVDQPAVVAAAEKQAGHSLNGDDQVFAVLRRWKDSF